MSDTLTRIQEALSTGELPPHTLAQYKVDLAAEYSFVAGQLEQILARKPVIWNTMRAFHKSDKATDREYEATSDGIDEVGLRWRIKRIEKLMGAISSLLRVAEGEAKNNY